MTRLLEDRTAVIYGAGGAIGVPLLALARKGAQAFLTGHRLAPLERVATEIKRAGGTARTAQVDALDEAATERRLDQVVEQFGGVDISFNAVGFKEAEGVPLVDLSRNGRLS